jgi:deoxyribonuclease IV
MALLGAHVSTSGGLEHAITRGIELDCEAIQIFTRNQMQWTVKTLSEEEILAYRTAWETLGKSFPVISHDSYLINLGSPEPEKLEKSRKSFLTELDRCDALGVQYLVFHPGSHLNLVSVEQCLQTIAESLNHMVQARPEMKVQILLENTAGQGSNVGHRFEEIAAIMGMLEHPERFGVCVDTCHTLAAGYDIRTKEGYETVFTEFDRIIGVKWIKAFHLNDSKKPLGCRVDRHENIGEGFVGIEAFSCLVNDSRFYGVPMVLETPGGESEYRKNLDRLKQLRHTRA